MREFLVAPSILSADFANLSGEIQAVAQGGADWIHVDVMDGHFVSNLTVGASVVKSIRPVTPLPLDVHLMVESPENYIKDFVQAGADYLTIHVEATRDPKAVLNFIRQEGAHPGISLKPATAVDNILPFLDYVDLVLIMTVEPGWSGQVFMRDQLSKARQVRRKIDKMKRTVLLEVDGGVNAQTVGFCMDFDVLVSGSYVFKGDDYLQSIQTLKGIKK